VSGLSRITRGRVSSARGVSRATRGRIDMASGGGPVGANAPDELHLTARVLVAQLGARVELHAGGGARVEQHLGGGARVRGRV
jgi:hypothetical protein